MKNNPGSYWGFVSITFFVPEAFFLLISKMPIKTAMLCDSAE
jgi:hypothetical protein